LDDDDQGANATVLTATIFSALNIVKNKWVTNVFPRNDMCSSDREAEENRQERPRSKRNVRLPTVRVWMVLRSDLDEQSVLSNIRWNALELKCLEASPAKKSSMR
jgi:hypothetical protein